MLTNVIFKFSNMQLWVKSSKWCWLNKNLWTITMCLTEAKIWEMLKTLNQVMKQIFLIVSEWKSSIKGQIHHSCQKLNSSRLKIIALSVKLSPSLSYPSHFYLKHLHSSIYGLPNQITSNYFFDITTIGILEDVI